MKNEMKWSWSSAVLLVLTAPLFLGTTFVVRENGVEVGRWIENDQRDGVRYIEHQQTALRPTEREAVKTSGLVRKPIMLPLSQEKPAEVSEKKRAYHAEYIASLDREAKRWQLEKERRNGWGIREGMSLDDVERVAQKHGVFRVADYFERYKAAGKHQKVYLVYEYRYRTANFKHTKKVYFNTTDTNNSRVVKVLHQATPR